MYAVIVKGVRKGEIYKVRGKWRYFSPTRGTTVFPRRFSLDDVQAYVGHGQIVAGGYLNDVVFEKLNKED